MNIFVLSPVECASFHNDKHVVKMIVEYAQLLSSVHRVYGYDHESFSVVKELQFPSFMPNIGITPFVLAMPD